MGVSSTVMDDTALATCLATDLDGAFETLVGAHADRLFSISLRLIGDPRDAEEVTQDAFVRAYCRGTPRFPPGSAWAYSNHGFRLAGERVLHLVPLREKR